MSGYRDTASAHTSYGSLAVNGQLLPAWEAAGFFAAQALGPIVHSAGYPMPATLPAGLGGSAMGYGASASGGFNWKLLAILVVAAAIGIGVVHHLHWRA